MHWEELVKNLGGDHAIAKRAVLALLQAATMAHPTGKQNSFGAFNLPDFVLVEVSERNLPVSYANAFLKPVKGFGDESLLANAVAALNDYVARLSKAYNLAPQRAHIAVTESEFLGQEAQPSLDDLGKWLEAKLG